MGLNQIYPVRTLRIKANVLLKFDNFFIFAHFVVMCISLSTQQIQNVFKLLEIYVLLEIGVVFKGFD